jgi:hypothetical protein
MAPHLLSIPGEIRNMIYEYALTENDGVCYREDAQGVAWACTYHFGEDVANAADIRDDTIHNSKSDGPEFVQPSESAVIDPEKPHGLASIEPGNFIIVNQLQFVCRQLRNETKGLVLRCNTITFAERIYSQSSKRCADFVQTLPAKYKPYIHTLIVKHFGGVKSAAWPTFTGFCFENPNSEIRVETYKATHNPIRVIIAARMYEHVLQKRIPLLDSMSSTAKANIEQISNDYFSRIRNEAPVYVSPKNLRVFPRPGPFDEVKFIRDAEQSRITKELVVPGLKGGMDTFVALAKDFVENGW